MMDSDLRLRRFTPAAAKTLNLIDTDIGRPIGDLKLGLEIPNLPEMLLEVIDKLNVLEQEVQDRQRRWYKLSAGPYRTPENKIDGVVLVLADIQVLKETQQAIQASLEYSEAIVETVQQPLLILNGSLRVKTANASFYKMFQVSPAETENQSVYDLGNKQLNIPELRKLLERILPQNGQFHNFQVQNDFPNAGPKTMLLNARKLQRRQDQEPLILLAIEDITDREQMERTKFFLGSIVESADDAIISKTLDGMITSWNSAAQRLFGYSADEILGKSVSLLIPPELSGEELQILEKLRRGQGIHHYETQRIRKDGSLIDVSLTISPIRDGQGGIIGASKIAHDISERKRLEDERDHLLEREREARVEAEELSRSKDEFLATVSHELRTPLNSILGWSNLLNASQLNESETARALESIERNARGQAKLIEDLVDASSIVAGKLRLDPKEVDLAEVTKAAIDTVRLTASAKRIQIVFRDEAGAALVLGDPQRLEQVVWNLLINAIKFTPPEGRIDVRLDRTDSGARIWVTDTGQGIKAEFIPFLFQRFRQGDSSITRKHGGLGLAARGNSHNLAAASRRMIDAVT